MKRISHFSWHRVLVLAAHPDDESLGAGGLIQQALSRGAAVRVVVVTNGDNNPWPQRYVERRWRIEPSDRARWGGYRRNEAIAALACLGVPHDAISFWGYPDQGLTRLLMAGGEELIARLSDELQSMKPTVVVAPSLRDLHPDHSSLAVMLSAAMARTAINPMNRSAALLEYIIHQPRQEMPRENFRLILSDEEKELKREAISKHATQMALSRRRFPAYAQSTEAFAIGRLAADEGASENFSAQFEEDALCLKISHAQPGARLLVACESSERRVRYSIEFQSSPKPALLRATAADVVTPVPVVRCGGHDELRMPAPLFASVKTIYVKRDSKYGFFDPTGWCEIPVTNLAKPVNTLPQVEKVAARVCCVVPCYNIASVCGPVVREAAETADLVIAINDGSSDRTGHVLNQVAAQSNGRVKVLSFPQNRGKGAALIEAFRWISSHVACKVIVTLDGDGQHRPSDIPRLARNVIDGHNAFSIGERIATGKMPLRSRLGNTLTARLIKLFYPAAPVDTQSGFRAFHPAFIRTILNTIQAGRYETEFEILLLALQQKRRIGSVTIPTVYFDKNRLSHFRVIADSWRIYKVLFLSRFHAAVRVKNLNPSLEPNKYAVPSPHVNSELS